jgi:IMP cyclohydrolase
MEFRKYPEVSPNESGHNWEALSNPNPGRLVLASREQLITATGGRSDRSLNRGYSILLNGDIRTRVYDPSKPKGDPRFTIYTAISGSGRFHVASNGAQTEDFVMGLNQGETFDEIQERWEHEGPEADNTPRITAALDTDEGLIFMGIVKPKLDNPERSIRESYCYNLNPDYGVYFTTYNGKGGTSSFEGEPRLVYVGERAVTTVNGVALHFDKNTIAAIAGRDVHPWTKEINQVRREGLMRWNNP